MDLLHDDSFGSQVYYHSAATVLTALAEFAAGPAGGSTIACMSLGAALAPGACLTRMVEEHTRAENWCTTLGSIPSAVAPVVIERPIIEIALAVQRLAGNRDFAPALPELFRNCVQVAQQSGDSSAKSGELDAISEFGLDPTRVPDGIDLDSLDGTQRLTRLMTRFDPAAEVDGKELLYAWKADVLTRCNGIRSTGAIRRPIRHGRQRILFSAWASGYSGAAASLCDLANMLRRDGCECFAMLGADGHLADRLRSLGATVTIASEDFASATFSAGCIADAVLRTVRPDILHINEYSGVVLPLLARARGIPVLYHLRVSHQPPEIVEALRASHHIVAVSDYVRTGALRHNIPPEDITVLYDGVDLMQWRPVSTEEHRAAKQALGIPPDAIVILMVGRYEPNKRQDVLVNAAAALQSPPRTHLLLVGESFGDSAWEDRIDHLLAEAGLTEKTTKLGFQRDMRPVQAASDVTVLCSQQEALGTSVLEAMATGVPVIVSGDGGLKELVLKDGGCGFVCRSGDANELSAALRCLIEDGPLRSALGARARFICERHCSAEVQATRVAALYMGLRKRVRNLRL